MSNPEFVSAPSLAYTADHPDRRQAERTYTVFRVARLMMPHGDQLGIVRNISEHGVMLELHTQVAIGDQVTLDLGEGHRLQGEVRWRNDMAVGLNFLEPINVARVLGKNMIGHDAADGKVTRLPRFRADSPAEITRATRNVQARLVNISIGGACVETDAEIAPREQIALTVPSLPTKVGTVRWKRGNLVGIVFGRPMSVQVLMEWLASRQKEAQPASTNLAESVASLTDERLADLYRSSLDQLAMVVVTDRKGIIVRANQRFQRCSGYSSDELVGVNFYDLHVTQQADNLIEAIAEGQVWRGALELVGSNETLLRLNAMIVSTANCPDLLTCFMFDSAGQNRTSAPLAPPDPAGDTHSLSGSERPTASRSTGGDPQTLRSEARSALPLSSHPCVGAGRDIAQEQGDQTPLLSRRELEVLRKVADGLSNEEIGTEIGLSRRTVELYRAKLLSKLGANNTASAVLIACKKGLL